MKKFLSLILIAACIILPLSSCDSDGDNDKPGKNDKSTEESTSGSDTPTNVLYDVATVIADTDEYSITAVPKRIEPTKMSYELTFVNKTADKAFSFAINKTCFNNLQVSSIIYNNYLKPSETKVDTLRINDSSDSNFIRSSFFDNSNCTKVTDVEIGFAVYEDRDMDPGSNSITDLIAQHSAHLYPYGEKFAFDFERTPQETDILVTDNEYCTVTLVGYGYGSNKYTLYLLFQNKTDTDLSWGMDSVYFNGINTGSIVGKTVLAGTNHLVKTSWSSSGLAKDGVSASSIHDMSFGFHLTDANGDYNIKLYTEDISFSVSPDGVSL